MRSSTNATVDAVKLAGIHISRRPFATLQQHLHFRNLQKKGQKLNEICMGNAEI